VRFLISFGPLPLAKTGCFGCSGDTALNRRQVNIAVKDPANDLWQVID